MEHPDPYRNFFKNETIEFDFSKSDQGLCILNSDLKVVYWSSNMEKMSGIEKNLVVGDDPFKGKYAHLFPVKRGFVEAVENRTSLLVDHQNKNNNKWFRISLFPVEDWLLIVLVDITEEKQNYLDLVYVRNLKKHVLNSTSDFIWAIDPDYKLILGNNSYLEIMRETTGREIR